jgi:hypothetical protein
MELEHYSALARCFLVLAAVAAGSAATAQAPEPGFEFQLKYGTTDSAANDVRNSSNGNLKLDLDGKQFTELAFEKLDPNVRVTPELQRDGSPVRRVKFNLYGSDAPRYVVTYRCWISRPGEPNKQVDPAEGWHSNDQGKWCGTTDESAWVSAIEMHSTLRGSTEGRRR